MYRTRTDYSRAGLSMAKDYEMCLSSMCRHVSNDSSYSQPFLLEDFQRENLWKPIFACGEMEGSRFKRKFRRAIFGLPSGFGKTELAAAIVLTVATMEVIHNGQYGVVASSKDQVRNIYEKIATMIRLNPIWRDQWEVGKTLISHRETGARIMVLPNRADALESWHFNVLIFDELHTYKDSSVWDAGVKGQKVLWNPLAIGITTAGDTRSGFLWDTLEKAPNDPAMYTYWLGLDDEDDLDDPASWEKMMVASWVTKDNIEEQRNMASTKRAFERYTANRFPKTNTAESCFTDSEISKCYELENDFDFSRPFTMGIDGATTGDSFAITAYQERDGIAYTREWVFDDPDTHYPMVQILDLVAGIAADNHPEVIGIDPSRLIVFASQLEETYGLEPVSFPQSNPVMCQASGLVIKRVKGGMIRLKGCEKTRAHLSNAVALEREPYGVRFGKDKRKSKIDAAISLAIAMLAYDKLVAGTEGYVPVF